MQKKEELLNALLVITPGKEDQGLIRYLKKPELRRVYDTFQEWKRIYSIPWTQVETIKYLVEHGYKKEAEEACQLSGEAWNNAKERFWNLPVWIDTPVHGNTKLIARITYYPWNHKITARCLSYQERKELKYF